MAKKETYFKVVYGFVTQTYEKQKGKFVCVEQDFNASDDINREDELGNNIDDEIDDSKEVDFQMLMIQPSTK
jgi:hypothetical protein